MPVRKLAGPNNVPTPWGVSMMEVFKNKGLAVPGVSAEGFLIVRFRRGSVARIEWRELCDAEGRPRAFFILKLGSSILGIKDVRIVVEGAKVRRKIDHIQTIELHQSA